jgi:nitrite reductase/ring-hydroxylating ferredoxin subunit
VRYTRGLARALVADGGLVFEQSRALGVSEGDPCEVRLDHATVRADHVVVATHYPILDRGLYFTRLDVQRSYCLAARLAPGSERPAAMAISAGSTTRSVRGFGADGLIVGGEGHPAGSPRAQAERFAALEDFAREHWDVVEVTHRWSAQDPVPYDHLPLVGPYRPGSSHLWVTTGYLKWGLATATFGAEILAARIAGEDHLWAARFDPNRLSLRSLHEVARLGVEFSADFVVDRVRPAAGGAADLPPGEARVVRDGLTGRTGVYRDRHGSLHGVSLRCTHLGCLLRFNAAETSWDCPCHGSRFGVDGEVLEGPAVHPLARRDVR